MQQHVFRMLNQNHRYTVTDIIFEWMTFILPYFYILCIFNFKCSHFASHIFFIVTNCTLLIKKLLNKLRIYLCVYPLIQKLTQRGERNNFAILIYVCEYDTECAHRYTYKLMELRICTDMLFFKAQKCMHALFFNYFTFFKKI